MVFVEGVLLRILTNSRPTSCARASAVVYLRRDHHKASVADDAINSLRRTFNRSELSQMIIKGYGNPRILEKSIRLHDGMYVDIRDVITTQLRVRREIVTGTLEYSSMYLKWPDELTLNQMDTTKWEVDHGGHHFSRYTFIMIEEMFLSGSVPLQRDVNARVLSLGLGAGYVNSYLHHHFPKMDITVVELDPQIAMISRKWFDLKLDQRQHLIVGDAMDYIKNANLQGEKFDVILLDACSTEGEAQCPLKEAINKESAEMFSSLLNERGALIANVFTMASDNLKFGNKVRSYYGGVFVYCPLRRTPTKNFVMTCTNHPRPEGLRDEHAKFMRYAEAGAEAMPAIELL
ncbi:unnamed protein product [Cylicocyclus nassatus]|uniref:Uncharacterized protein n=1 Tax=Cylicocyclus nassatus TaxID=53992 RepID=A0AA36GYA3_CYLNA|nr:unnamed protein product [Cylicocyclus nassatus]